mmetsp:Transcript_26480/g.47734  ORF Transcript_26480/g.47734 Transcript_26480/m.47734 type:complete len:182 (+) Transcript_26480:241-786(+)
MVDLRLHLSEWVEEPASISPPGWSSRSAKRRGVRFVGIVNWLLCLGRRDRYQIRPRHSAKDPNTEDTTAKDLKSDHPGNKEHMAKDPRIDHPGNKDHNITAKDPKIDHPGKEDHIMAKDPKIDHPGKEDHMAKASTMAQGPMTKAVEEERDTVAAEGEKRGAIITGENKWRLLGKKGGMTH